MANSVAGDQVIVEGAVQRNPFQSILLNEVFVQKEGHSFLRTAAVAIVALPLIPLLAVYDLARYGLFQYGYCNGKSWSLIDKTGETLQSLASRIQDIVPFKPAAVEHPNAKSGRLMREYVGKILDGYRKEQGGWFFGRLFDSSKAIAGEKQVIRHLHLLAQEVAAFLSRNVKRCEEFASYAKEIKEHLHSLFVEMAGDDIFIENKMERKGLGTPLAVVAGCDLTTFFEKNPYTPQSL